jgi:2'-hydroxyisoflavone reductase
MKILVLGGSMFVGRAIVAGALARGWGVTTFNRGRSGEDVDGVRAIRGDRNRPSDVEALAGLDDWDAVVDTSAYVPRDILGIARALRPSVGRCVLLSTVSVYADWPRRPLSEDSPTLPGPPDAGPDFGPDDIEDGPTRYGFLKAGCERAVRGVFGDARTMVLRPGVILGPGEYVGRLPWWLNRVAQGGEILAPGPPERSIQPIDVRDLADFALRCLGAELSGIMNTTGPIGRETFGTLLAGCMAATESFPTVVWTDQARLAELGVRQWSELPLWRVYDGVWKVDSSRAQNAGLATRSLMETTRDTWAWMQSMGEQRQPSDRSAEIGMTRQRERDLLDQLRRF